MTKKRSMLNSATIQVEKSIEFDHARLDYEVNILKGYKDTSEAQHDIGIVGTYDLITTVSLCDKEGNVLKDETGKDITKVERTDRHLPIVMSYDGVIKPRGSFRTGGTINNMFIMTNSLLYSVINTAWHESKKSKMTKSEEKEAFSKVQQLQQERNKNRIQSNDPNLADIAKQTNNYEGPSK